jgi:Concanavalin A-like lectin/glucanases superfamily
MKQGSTRKRSRLAGGLAGASALFVFLVLPLSPPARADSTNLIPNSSFLSGTSGWTTSDAALTIASDGSHDSHAGRVALNTTASSSSVIGLWHLDETSGTTAFDSSGNGNDGAISGPVTLGVPGHLKTAYSFVPKSTVIVPNASDLVPGTAKITISYWLKTTTLPCCNAVDYDMFTKGDGSSKGGQIKIEVQGNGQASCMFRGASGKKQLQAGPNVVDGQWHQVTCVRDGTRIVETVDGASFSVTKATGAITVTDSIRLGSHKGGGDWYKGVLDEVTYSIG